jgi:hypothetical protein
MATDTWAWTGSGTDEEWSFTGGWSGGVVPASGDTVIVPANTDTLVLTSVALGSGGPVTTTNVTVAAATVNSGGSWNIEQYGHTVTITNNLEVDGGMSITDPFDLSSTTINIGGSLIVTNSGGGIGIGNYLQGGRSGMPGIPTTVLVTAHDVTNSSGTNDGTIVVDTDAGDGSTATLLIQTNAAVSGVANTLIGNFEIGTDGTHSGGGGLLEFADGQITTIQGQTATIGRASLSLYGSQSFVADENNIHSNSALIGLNEVDGTLILQDGVGVLPGGSLTIGSSGDVNVDVGFEGIAGSELAITSTLTLNGALSIGRSAMTGIGLVTAAAITGSGSLSLDGADSSDQGRLIISSAAGDNGNGVLDFSVEMQDSSLLQFASGKINTIALNASLEFSGANAFIADLGSTGSNSALTGLTEIDGSLNMQTGVVIAPTGSVTIGSNGHVSIDTGFLAIAGSQFNVTNALTVNGSLGAGRSAMTGNTQILAGSLMGSGTITMNGADAGDMSKLIVSGSAGFGGSGTVTGSLTAENYSLIEFGSGQINTIAFGGSVIIDGTHAFIADNGALTTNSALTGLSTVAGTLTLLDGTSITATSGGGVTLGDGTHGASIQVTNGSSFSVTGTLNLVANNNSVMNIGGRFDTASPIVTVGALMNSDGINIDGNAGQPTNSTLKINGALSGAGTITLNTGGVLEIGTTATGGTITFQSGNNTVKLDTATTLGEALSGFASGDTIDLASLTYKSTYLGLFSSPTTSSGTLDIVDTATGNTVASLNLNNGSYGDKFSVSSDGGSGTDITLTNTPLNAAPPAATSVAMLMQFTDGTYEIFDIGQNSILAAYQLPPISTQWTVKGLGDFEGTDTDDMMMRNSAGALTIYNLNSNNLIGSASMGQVGPEWSPVGFADFSNNANETDMLMRDTSVGTFELYDIRNDAYAGFSSLGQVGPEWSVAGFADFSGKAGETDMLMRNSNTGAFELFDIANNNYTGFFSMGQVGLEWSVSGFGDFSGNAGETDMLMRNTSGEFEIFDIANNNYTGFHDLGNVGVEWQVAGFGDFSGNAGETDMLMRNSNTGAFELYDIANNQFVGFHSMGQVGVAWRVAAIGPVSSTGTGASSTQMAQAIASLASSGASNTTPTATPSSTDPSQQSLLTTPHSA